MAAQSKYPVYSQGDPRWGTRKLNTLIFRKTGCLITALASKMTGESGKMILPPDLDLYLDKNDGYLRGNDTLKWDSVAAFAKIYGLSYRVVFDEYKPGEPAGTIVMVKTPWGSTHFVLSLSDGVIMDPAGGRVTSLEARKYVPKGIRWL